MHCPYGVLLCAGHVLPSCDSSCLDAVLLRLRLRLELKLKLGSVDLPRFAQGVLAAFFLGLLQLDKLNSLRFATCGVCCG